MQILTNNDREALGILLKRYVRPYFFALFVAVVVSVVVGGLVSLRPLLLAPGLDAFIGTHVQPATGLSSLTLNNLGSTIIHYFSLSRKNLVSLGIFIAAGYVVVTIIMALLSQVNQWILVKIRTAIQRDIMVDLHRSLLRLPMSFFNRSRSGELVSRLTNDVSNTANGLDVVVRGILQSAAQIVITLVVLLRTDALFAVGVVSLGAIHLAITKTLGERLHKATADAYREFGNAAAGLLETFIGIRVIKAFAAERFDSNRIASIAETFRRQMTRYRLVTYIETPARMVGDSVVIGVVLVAVFYGVSSGRFSLTSAAIFFYLSQQMVTPISQLFSKLLAIHGILGGAERLFGLMKEKPVVVDGAKVALPFDQAIDIRHVSFHYENDKEVLHDINLSINKGEMVALVGPSGSGKSTLADLLLRFYDVCDGEITYNGQNIKTFRQRSYRRHFGVVAQESLLFNGTVLENVIFNRKFDADKFRRAILAANADEFIKQLPQGENTIVGDRGVRLSGGQRQRIAIARAIYDEPQILILDEATSALDSESEKAVQTAINRITKGVTSIVIAHRLSTIVRADKIVVLKNGVVEGIGRHAQLLRESMTYKKLYTLQFGTGELGVEATIA